MGCLDIQTQEPTIPMYVLTNEVAFLGARLLYASGMLEYIREQIGRDYFILPSSTHGPRMDRTEQRRYTEDMGNTGVQKTSTP